MTVSKKNRRHDVSDKKTLSYIIQQFRCWGLLHFDVSEEFLACIFKAGPEEIYHIVDNQEAIVIALRGVYINRWILLVMSLQIQLLLLVQLTGVDGGSDTRRTITEHRQGINIDIVVDKDDGAFRLFDEVDDLCVGIEDLPVVEDAFHWG